MPEAVPVAIVGLSCRLPGGASDLASATRLFRAGVDAVRPVPPERFVLPARTPSGRPVPRDAGLLDRVDTFDAALFGISPREARAMDPQQRLLLEAAWAALEDAGQAPDALSGARAGVFVGMGLVDWARRTFASADPGRLDAWSGTGVFDSVAAGRVAYALGLRGPALAVHTACSSSLVALHLAVRSLRAGECDLALAGGVNLLLAPEPTVYFAELQALSAGGRCRTFDAAADGYVRGEGVGLLALRRLDDAERDGDRVHAVVLGTAVNQDGRTSGLTAPSGRAQQDVIREALADAGVRPAEVGYVEAHGTGTPLGDPIEMAALAAALGEGDRALRVGSAKTQIGHLEAAAGVAGVVRAIGALQGVVPPHLHLGAMNERIRLDGTRIRVPTSAEPWTDERRVAGVSSFGLSGTNAHVVLAQAPPAAPGRADGPVLVAVTGATAEAVQARIAAVRAAEAPLPDVARGAADGRATLPHRAVRLAATRADLDGDWQISIAPKEPPLAVWAFAGQGAQVSGMGARLYAGEPVYREVADRVEATFRARTGASLLDVVHAPSGPVDRTEWTQPALLLVQLALAELLRSWGFAPDAVLGHSVGEIAAAAVAGVLSVEDAVALATERGRLLGALPEGGAMAALRTTEDAVRAVLGGRCAIAAVNAPDEVVVSGAADAVERVIALLPGVRATRLAVSHAFHSPLVAPAADALEAVVAGLRLLPPRVPLYSALTGRLAGDEIATPTYWRRHLLEPVRFADAVRAAADDGHALFVEISPRRTLTGAGARSAPDARWIGPSDERALGLAGALFLEGFRPAWRTLHRGAARADLPPYPFAKERHWIEPHGRQAPPPAWRLVPEVLPRASVAPGRWRVDGDGELADALRARLPAGDERVLWLATGAVDEALVEAARRLRSGLRLWIAAADDVLAHALAGFGATAALEAPDRFGGVLRLAADATADAVVDALAADEDAAVGEVARADRIVADALPAGTVSGTVWITGGSGALGTALGRRLLDRGLRVVAISRSGRGLAGVTAVAADVTDEDALRVLLATGAPSAVFHLAGTATHVPADELDQDDVRAVLQAKLDGALALARVLPPEVRLVLASSIAGVWGSPTLAAYGAANRALHALARRRPSTAAVALGPIDGGGMASADELRRFAEAGVSALSADEAAEALEAAADGPAERIVARVDWAVLAPLLEARRARPLLARVRPAAPPPPVAAPVVDLEDVVAAEVAAVLGSAGPIDPDTGFFDLGLDSVMAVELVQRIRSRTGLSLPPTATFDHPTLRALVRALSGSSRPAVVHAPASNEPIAIVGFSCRLPGAADPEAYWALLRDGVDAVGPVPAGRWDAEAWPEAPRAGGFLPDLAGFEPDFFGLTAREASALDPQQRLLLEVSWEALERAGIAPDRLDGANGGVFVGVGRSEYWDRVRHPAHDAYPWSGTGNAASFAAGRLSHLLGLRGPALSIDTACSSSLVAVHLACRALRDGEADLALAGGVNALLSPEAGTWLARIGALSPSGRCRTFDAAADGYVRGEGCAVVVLKRMSTALADGDRVWAVVRGSAVGHDGRASGLTAPSGPAQEAVLRRALASAGVDPADVSVLEAHGTGTPLGDPIEVGAVHAVYGQRARPLVVTAVKSQIGHLESAAGVAGLVKLVLALAHRRVPGTLHLAALNPALPGGPSVRFATAIEPWPDGPPIAAISSFGISGTDAHLVVEGPPSVAPTSPPSGPSLLLVSAHTRDALAPIIASVDASIARYPRVDVASLLAHGRAARRFRAASVGSLGQADVVEASPRLRVGFLFTGQGAQHPAMARALHERDPVFRGALDELVAPYDGLRDVLLGEDERVHDTRWTQPALVALALALARRWAAFGVVPAGVLGHSVGEIAAAAVAGVLSEADAMRLAVARGDLVAELPPGGRMVAVRAAEDVVRARLLGRVDVAGVNAPDEVVVAGDGDDVARVVAALEADGVAVTALRTSHAFHSPLVDPVVRRLAAVADALPHAPPRLAFVSALGATDAAIGPDHWPRHLRAPVRFADAFAALADRVDVLVELGPRPVLSALGARIRPDRTCLASLRPGRDPLEQLLETAGALWARGARLDPAALVPKRPPVPLPTTPWQRVRCWIEEPGTPPEPPDVPMWLLAYGPARFAGPPANAPRVVRPRDVAEALAALKEPGPVALVTCGARTGDAGQAAIWGLAASVALERGGVTLVEDMDGDGPIEVALACGEDRVVLRGGGATVPRLRPAPRADRFPVSTGTWLVTGGGGAVGEHVVRWLLARGASPVVVGRRRPASAPEGAAWHQADVSRRDDVERVLARTGPLAGIVHLAGVAHGALLRDLDAGTLAAVAAAKVDGARHLDALAGDVPMLLFSSAIAWLGLPGQGAYGAANAALEAFARQRQERGRLTRAIAWGPWTVGMAEGGAWADEGVRALAPGEALRALDAALSVPSGTLVLPVDWERFSRARGAPPWVPGAAPAEPVRALLAARLRDARPSEREGAARDAIAALVTRVLGREEALAPSRGFFDAGLDSLGAVDLARRLSAELGLQLPPTAIFDHPDVAALADHVLARLELRHVAPVVAAAASVDEPVAIVGMACRFPGADDPDALWDLVRDGRVAIRDVPRDRWDAETWADRIYARHGGFLDGIDRFDPEFFGISPREAASMDPQQRLLLEVAWEAVERAGRTRGLRGSRAGVFVGVAERNYLQRFRSPGAPMYPDAWAGTGTEPSFAAGRVAFALGVHGPALAVNTTCSSSLVAVHLAAQSLRRGECDLALAGGVALMLLPDDTAYLCTIGALSRSGRCHVFDARADGYVRGEGCGVVVLRRLSDAERDGDEILAVIRGSAVNHDGPSAGLTVPNGAAQEEVLRAALAAAGARPAEVGYLEAHGTGTPLGDPIEVRAALAVYGEARTAPLHLGAVKANVGHTELAAGVASLVKTVQALRHRTVPPLPDLRERNPALELGGAVLPTRPVPWPDGAPLAAISAFGLSGTNAHVVLEAGPASPPPAAADRPVHVVGLSARSEGALVAWGHALAGRGPLPGVAASVHARVPFEVRAAVVAADADEAAPLLRALVPRRVARPPKVAFLFSGQGSQFAGMGLALAERSPTFAAALDRCARVLDPMLGVPLRELLADGARLGTTLYTQPALLAVQWATAQTLRAWGVEPAVVAGHSLGEIVAATVAGVWPVDDALRLVVRRGRLMEELALPGAMAAVGAAEDVVRAALVEGAEVAAVNAPDEVVVAGPAAAVDATLARLGEVRTRRLDVSRPFHSSCVEPMLDAFADAVGELAPTVPEVPVVSLVSGEIESEAYTSAGFWRRHARAPVRCADGLRAIAALGCDVLVDVGAHPTMLGLARRTIDAPGLRTVATARRDADAWRVMAEAVGALFEAGVDVDWRAWDEGARGRTSIPTTPFDRRRFWLEEPAPPADPLAYAVRWDDAVSAAPVALAEERVVDARGTTADELPDRILELAEASRAEGTVVLVTAEGRVDPVQRALWGAARCLQVERPGRLVVADVAPSAVLARDVAVALGTGEDLVVVRDGRASVPRLERVALAAALPSVSGTWLVTGGLGAIGLAVARWLRERGAARLVLVSRRAPDDGEGLAALRASGAEVVVARVDVADRDAVAALLAAHPPDGVVHAAGVTLPQAADALDRDTVRATVHGKLEGARVLDALLGERPLQGFVLMGSIAAVWGSRELTAYAAANAYLDGLAARRRARGLAATSIAWGPWGGGGMVDDARAAELARAGLERLDPARALGLLGAALASGRAELVVARVAWDRLVPALEARGPRPLLSSFRPAAAPSVTTAAPADVASRIAGLPEDRRAAALVAHLEARVRALMRLDPARPLAPDTALADLGFDSLMATELKSALLADGLDVPLGRLLGGPPLEEVAGMVLARLAPAAEPVAAAPATDEPDRLLLWTHLAAFVVGVGLAAGIAVLLLGGSP